MAGAEWLNRPTSNHTMKPFVRILLVSALVIFGKQAEAQVYDNSGAVVQTFAGSGFSGYVDGQGQLTMFDRPSAIVADSSSNLSVWDSSNYRVRKIYADGTVTTFAGGGSAFSGAGTNVSLFNHSIKGMAIDRSNNIWLAAGANLFQYLVRIGSDGNLARVATNLTELSGASGACVDSFGNFYYSGNSDNRIYRFGTNRVLEVFAGSGNAGRVDGNGIFSSFDSHGVLACDAADNIYVWDAGQAVRRINQNRDVVTIAGFHAGVGDIDGSGKDAAFNSVSGMCADNLGNLYFACGSSVRKMGATTNVVTLAGSFSVTGYTNGAGNVARFNGASGICVAQGSVFVAEINNHRIRQISFNPGTNEVAAANLNLNQYPGLRITGTVGRTYHVQTSTDATNWTTRATLLLTTTPYLWMDPNPISGNKFYRALLLP